MAGTHRQDGAVLPPFRRSASPGEREGEGTQQSQNAFYGLAHAQVNPVGFKVLFADGAVAFVQYHDLVSPLTFDGSGEIGLRTPAMSLKISGRNLAALFDHLCSHRVAWVREPEGSFFQAAEGQAEIESIRLAQPV